MNENEYEWISVAEFAKRHNISKQTCYNWCKQGKVEYMSFQRQTMCGILVKVAKEII